MSRYFLRCVADYCSASKSGDDELEAARCVALTAYSHQCSHVKNAGLAWRTQRLCRKRTFTDSSMYSVSRKRPPLFLNDSVKKSTPLCLLLNTTLMVFVQGDIPMRCKFFSERIVNTWNNLPSIVDFSSLSSFIRTVKLTDLSDYLRCF